MTTPTNPSPRSEVHIGGSRPEDWGLFPFTITAVHSKRKPTRELPFHAPGGDWTFLDCRADDDPNVMFTVGVTDTGSSTKSVPSAWGQAILATADKDAGERFINHFCRAFRVKPPTARTGGLPPEPLDLRTAILGIDQKRHDEGGFSGTGGGWVATKWFPSEDDLQAEVFFNYNLVARRGEFSEKDADYRNDLIAIFATALRDGARPLRTPETDPNLTRDGPRIEHVRKLTDGSSSHPIFSPDNRHAVFEVAKTVFALALPPSGEPFEIAQFDHAPWTVHLADSDLNLLVQEGVSEQTGIRSSADPMRIWWADRTKKEKVLLRGPEKDLGLCESPLSPNGRFVAMQTYRDNPTGKGRYAVVSLLDRTTGKTRTVDIPGQSLSVTAWKAYENGPKAIAVANRWEQDSALRKTYLIDPDTGVFEQITGADHVSEPKMTSPDGKYSAAVVGMNLVLTERASGQERRFQFHEDDKRFVGEGCVKWVSPQYLEFLGPRLAFIDAVAMKMNYPAPLEKDKRFRSHGYLFTPDFRWVLYHGDGVSGEGLQLGRVRMPGD